MSINNIIQGVFNNTYRVKISDGNGVDKDIYKKLTLPELNLLLMSRSILKIDIEIDEV